MAILLAITIIYHNIMNSHLSPLEKYLPADLYSEDDDEERPLLEADDGPVEDRQPKSHIEHLGAGRVPTGILKYVAAFLEPQIFDSHQALKSWSKDPEDDLPIYSEEEVKTAYLDPALTSKMPKLWLARDELGISKHEIAENEVVGIASTEDGAWLNEKNEIVWPVDDLKKVPIFKMAVRY